MYFSWTVILQASLFFFVVTSFFLIIKSIILFTENLDNEEKYEKGKNHQ